MALATAIKKKFEPVCEVFPQSIPNINESCWDADMLSSHFGILKLHAKVKYSYFYLAIKLHFAKANHLMGGMSDGLFMTSQFSYQ